MTRIYISYGITKSASTFAWQLIKRTAISGGLPIATLTSKSKGANSPEDYIDPVSEQNLELIREDVGDLPVVIKTHGGVTPSVARLVAEGTAEVFASYRDLRDVALSLLDHGAKSRAKGIRDFAEFHNLSDTLNDIKTQVEKFQNWVQSCKPLLLSYDEVCFDTRSTIKRIAERLGVSVDVELIFDEFHSNKKSIGQFNKGENRRFEREMDAGSNIFFVNTFASYYKAYFPEEIQMIKNSQAVLAVAGEEVGPAASQVRHHYLTEAPSSVAEVLRPAMAARTRRVLEDRSIDPIDEGEEVIFEELQEESVNSQLKPSPSARNPAALIGAVPREHQKISSCSLPEYIYIHSHRRSGTHLLIDTISAWFDVTPGFCHLPPTDDTPLQGGTPAAFDTRLAKSQEPFYGFKLNEKQIWASQQHLADNRLLYEKNPHIYIVRNPFFVLRSLYIFDVMGGEEKFKIDQNLSFSDYLLGISMHEANVNRLNRIEYWKQHVLNWTSRSDVLIIDYDDLLQSKISTVETISQHVGCAIRSSQRCITPTGIGRGLTDRFLKGGRESVWEPSVANLMEAAIEHVAAVQPRMARHVDRWLVTAASDPRRSGGLVGY